ncbi:MAG: NADH-quinone oxidoreductase subunit G [Actinomycetota bacterium]|nr:NADH-quinone oxidoreductase subunit G [Actinomycetota bacterium]
MSDKKMVNVTIDDRAITVPEGTLVIRAAEQLGLYVPRFCDHPYLAPLGACRQCLVEIEGQRKPLTSCTTTVTEGMVVKTQFTSDIAAGAQKGVLELLLINHPLDCPVCDKGGECPLQDQVLAYGPGGSRYREPKRRYVKPVPVSPLVYLDRERCVLCARCTRFASEISGDPFIELFERGALEQVAIFEDQPYESSFSGNVIQICPVGALTDAEFRFKARPFDMTSTPSVCNLCSSGCSLTIQQRRGQIVRVLARDNPDVNEVWTCDKGRFGHAYVQRPERVVEPMIKKEGSFVPVSWAEAVRLIAGRIQTVKANGESAAVLAGARLPDEDAYAVSRFARTILGTNNVDHRLRRGSAEEDAVLPQLMHAEPVEYETLERAKLVVVAGLDPREESPILFLRLRKAALKHRVPIVELQPRRTALARFGARSIRCAPGTEADVLLAAATRLGERGGVDASAVKAHHPSVSALLERCGADADHVYALADLLQRAGSDAVFLAGERLSTSPGALAACWNLAAGLGAKFARVSRRPGAAAAVWTGLHPKLLPGGRLVDNDRERLEVEAAWQTSVPAQPGLDGRSILDGASRGAIGLLYLVAIDPAFDAPDSSLGARALDTSDFIVAHDLLLTESSRRADVLLPAVAVPERAGTFTDWEIRPQTFSPAVGAPGLAEPDWQILSMIAAELGVAFPRSLEDIRREIRSLVRPQGTRTPVLVPDVSIPKSTEHYPFMLLTYPLLLDDGTMMLGANDLMRTADDVFVELNAKDAERIGVEPGESVRVSSQHGAIEAPLRVLRDLPNGSVFIPTNQRGTRVQSLLDSTDAMTFVRVDPADAGRRG